MRTALLLGSSAFLLAPPRVPSTQVLPVAVGGVERRSGGRNVLFAGTRGPQPGQALSCAVLTAAAAGISAARRGAKPRGEGRLARAPPRMQLRTCEDGETLEALIAQTRDSKAVVVLHFADPAAAGPGPGSWNDPSWDDVPGNSWASSSFSLSGSLVSRVAETFATSALCGGSPVLVLQIDRDMPGMDLVCAQRGILKFPTTQVWSRGQGEDVLPGDLEQKLLSLGCATPSKRFDNPTGTATFESDLGTGKPSATAVDEIDFTGGRALGSNRDGSRGPRKSGRLTRDFFPGGDFTDKPGDNMNPKGNEPPSSPFKKDDQDPFSFGR